MSVTSLVRVGGVTQASGTLVGYVGTSVRGIQEKTSNPPFGPYAGQAMYQITLYANAAGERVAFTFNDGPSRASISQTLEFAINGNVGTVVSPLLLPADLPPPPPPSPAPPTPPTTCSELYLKPGGSTSVHEYVELPSVSGIRAISLWVWLDATQDDYPWDYLSDARPHLPNGWFAFNNFPTLSVGSQWVKLVVHDFGSTPGPTPVVRKLNAPLSGQTPFQGDRWYHVYVEADRAFSGDVHLLSRYAHNPAGDKDEDLHAKVISASMWSCGLTDAQVDDLAAGGLGPSLPSDGLLLASYNAQQAMLRPGQTQVTMPDALCRNADARVISPMGSGLVGSLATLATAAVLPRCIPILQSECISPPSAPSPPTPPSPSFRADAFNPAD